MLDGENNVWPGMSYSAVGKFGISESMNDTV